MMLRFPLICVGLGAGAGWLVWAALLWPALLWGSLLLLAGALGFAAGRSSGWDAATRYWSAAEAQKPLAARSRSKAAQWLRLSARMHRKEAFGQFWPTTFHIDPAWKGEKQQQQHVKK